MSDKWREFGSLSADERSKLFDRLQNEDYMYDDLTTADRLRSLEVVLERKDTIAFVWDTPAKAFVVFRDLTENLSASVHHAVLDRGLVLREFIRDFQHLVSAEMKRNRLHRVTVYIPDCKPHSDYALRLAELSGFQYEGCYRQAMLMNGKYRDLAIYGLLAREQEAVCR